MSLIGCHTLAGTGIEYPKKKPAWRYIKGDEKDFIGTPSDAHVYKIMYPPQEYYFATESELQGYLGVFQIIAQRELVTSVNDDRLAHDMVNHPSHYTQGGIECIDAIKAATVGKTGIEAVAVANVIKYLWRYEQKGGIESVKKARWYLERLINELSKGK